MATIDKDFIFSPKAKIVGATYAVGSFIGFKDSLFYIPDKIEETEYRSYTTTKFSFAGKLPSEIVLEMTQNKELTVDEMKDLLKELLPDNFQLHYRLENYRRFKISIPIFSFLRSITILPMGVVVPFQIIIKDKPFLEKAKQFYQGMEK